MTKLAAAALLLVALPAVAAEHIPFPAELKRDVDFWIRVYSEISTSQGFLHDEHDLSIVYRRLDFDRDVTPRARHDAVDEEREKIVQMLKHLASGSANLSDEEKRIQEIFGAAGTPARFREAAAGVRFQLGQADRFRQGLERSGTWEGHIEQTFARLGLPPELAALPHVESSFDPTAYSKVGAAGMWQFMRGTGKRYLRIDQAVDERMDPFRATEAAAQLLEYNYRLLGSWPLALTAYNHGSAGMSRARDAMGTTDIATIVRNYKSRSFGFASRNFYVSFLAALTIDRDPHKYFPDLVRRPEMTFVEVQMPAYIPAAALQESLGVGRAELAALNPALLAPVWDGRQYVPKGYRLRLPASASRWNTQQVAQSVAQKNQFQAQLRPGKAAASPVPEKVAQTLQVQRAEAQAVAKVRERAEAAEPVTAREAREQSPSLAPGGAVARATDTIDLSTAQNGTIRVAANETIGHYADWLGLPASRVRSLNGLTVKSAVPLGRAIKLDFSQSSREEFEKKRRAYHETLQAQFFAGHRIVGTRVHVIRRGESLWTIASRNGAVPTWLVLHYNPDIDFATLRAGQQIVIPKVEALPPA